MLSIIKLNHFCSDTAPFFFNLDRCPSKRMKLEWKKRSDEEDESKTILFWFWFLFRSGRDPMVKKGKWPDFYFPRGSFLFTRHWVLLLLLSWFLYFVFTHLFFTSRSLRDESASIFNPHFFVIVFENFRETLSANM